jgi:RimJ/RimL family protein N-acetyltransferase
MVGERVYLRATEAGDAEIIARIDAAETDTFMRRGRIPASPLDFESWIADAYRQQPPQHIPFSVCLKDGDRFIGIVGIAGIDWLHHTGETWSSIGPAEIRGQGYGTEAKHLLLEYCFDHLHLHVLRSEVNEPNTRSAAALAKQGYRPAGRRRWFDVKGGRYFDALLFDVTRQDWIAARDPCGSAR